MQLQMTNSHVAQLEQIHSQLQIAAVFKQIGVKSPAALDFLGRLLQWAVLHSLSSQQQLQALNLGLSLLSTLTSSRTKQEFAIALQSKVGELSKRDANLRQNFSCTLSQELVQFLRFQLVDYYELYEIVMDTHPHFQLQAVPTRSSNLNESALGSGNAIEPEGVAVLKQFMGVRAPKEEKKDVKKK